MNNRYLTLLVFFFINVVLSAQKSDGNEYDKLYNRLKSATTDTARVNANLDLCKYYLDKKSDSFFIYAKQVYSLSKSIKYKQGQSAKALGIAYALYNDYLTSTEYFIEAFNEIQKTNDNKELCSILTALGTNYYMTKNDKKALEYYTKAFNLSYNYISKQKTTVNLGQIHMSLENYPKALEYFQEALKLAEKEKNNKDIAVIYNRLGELYFLEADDIKSLYYFKKAIDMNIPDFNYLKISCMNCIARGCVVTGKFNSGIDVALQAYSLAEAEKNLNEQISSCRYLTDLYDSIGRTDMAYKYYTKFTLLKDSLFNIDKTKQINFLNIEFETAQKELQIADLEKEAKFRKILIIVFIFFGVLIVLILFNNLRNYRQKNKILVLEKEKLEQQKANEILEKHKLKLEVYEKDREILTHILQINQQKEALTHVSIKVNNIVNCEDLEQVYGSVKRLNLNILTSIKLCDDWDQIKLHFDKVHPNFFSSLKKDYSVLTLNELKLCAYTKLGFSIKEISRLLSINPGSVRIARYRLKKKLKISDEVNFCDFIETR